MKFWQFDTDKDRKKIYVFYLFLFLALAAGVAGLLSTTGFSAYLCADTTIPAEKNANWIYFQRIFGVDKVGAALFVFALFAAYCCLLQKIKPSKKDLIPAGILAFFFSLIQVIGASFESSKGWAELLQTGLLKARGLLFLLGWFELSLLLILYIFAAADRFVLPAVNAGESASGKKDEYKQILKTAGVILLCWLPYFIILFPGTNHEDTIYQITESFHLFSHKGLHSMSAWGKNGDFIHNHHPYLTTLFFGAFARIGRLLSGGRSIMAGVAIYSMLQSLMMAFMLSCGLSFMKKEGVGEKIGRGCFLFAALFPGFPLIAISMSKDSILCILLGFATLQLYQVQRSKGKILKDPVFDVKLFAVSFLICMTKSTGIYMVAIVGVVLMAAYRKNLLRIAAACFIPVLFVQFIWVPVLLPSWNVAPAGKQEMLGPLFQQTARYVYEHGDEVTKEEKKAINKVLKYKKIAKIYDSEITDPVKRLYRSDAGADEHKAYIKTWFSMLAKHPKSYIDATIGTIYPFYYISTSEPLFLYMWQNDMFSSDPAYGLSAQNVFSWGPLVVRGVVKALAEMPVIGLLLSKGFYTWVMILMVILLIRKKRAGLILPLSYLLLTILIFFIVPSAYTGRYSWPLITLLPIALCGSLLPEKTEALSQES